MRKVALRSLTAHKTRFVATFLAVALGVSFIGGVLTLTDTMNRSFGDLFDSVYEGTDAVVRSDETIGGGQLQTRGTVDATMVDQVSQVDGVARAAGTVEGFARVIDKGGDPVGDPNFGAPTLGGNWVDDDALNPFELREGVGATAGGEIVLDAATARSTGYERGDRVPIQTKAGVGDYELVGIAGFGTVDSPGGSTYVLFSTDEAQRVLSDPGKFDSISAVAERGVSEEELADRLDGAVGGSGIEVLTGTEITEESKSSFAEQLSFVTVFFLAFAIVAVVVGSFVIYNSFSIIVAQRTREMALLRALGASRRQVLRAVLVEAVAVGLVGSVAGFGLGLLVATVLTNLVGVEGSLAVLPASVATAVLTGLSVTVTSAWAPARRASKVAPLAAMRDVEVDRSGRSRLRYLTGLALVVLGVLGVVSGARGQEGLTVGLGLGVAFAGVIMAGPGLAGPVSTTLGWPLSRIRGITGSLARQNAGRNPRRSASTAQALMIGVGVMAFFVCISTSIQASIDKALDENFVGDFVVDSGAFGLVGMPHEVATEIAELPEVSDVAPLRFAAVRVDGTGDGVTATTPDAFDVFGLDLVEGSARLGDGEVVLLDELARDEGLAVGDRLTFDFLDSEPVQLTVAGVYDGPEANNLGRYVLGVDELARHVVDDSDAQVMVNLADGVTVEQARPALDAVAERNGGTIEVQSVEDYKDSLAEQLDVFLRLILGLLALAVVIAGLGIANTVALSVLERTRELGLLRAVGMTRPQLRSTIRAEAVVISLFGAVLGLAIGILGGWGMVTAFRDEGFEVFQVPYATIALMALLSAGLGLVAALLPAWRASRLDVLAAIHAD